MTVSITYGSAYSFMHMNSSSSFDEVLREIENLNELFIFFDSSKNNSIEFSNDYSDYKINGKTLEDNFLELTNDPSSAIFLLDELEKTIGSKKSYLNTVQIVSNIERNENSSFAYEYPLALNSSWTCLNGKVHIYEYLDVCNENSFNFKTGINDRDEFTDKAIDTYEHIQFSSVFSDKLKTIKDGVFTDYLNEFSHALNVLNQSFFKVSNDEAKNEEDLMLISELSKSEKLRGRGLDCTRQQGASILCIIYNPKNTCAR